VSWLRVDGVSRVFPGSRRRPDTVALEPIELDVLDNDFVAIVGPSGCGKSTLLRIAAGLDVPTTGRVLLDGAPVTGPGADRGMVFQEYALFPWLTVQQNVEYGLREQRLPRAEVARRSAHYLHLVGLEGAERRYPHELSGGMKQRVALIRVLANDPKILLMDEPFAAVDAQTRTLLQRELHRLWDETHKTVLFVTHSVDEALYLGDRVVVMTARPGRIKAVLTVDLPRPRDPTSDAFNAYRREATRLIEEEVQIR
jgi:NitT/TauT family transport system ATP-binding protein/sulfonate transport system ATP-binding protein